MLGLCKSRDSYLYAVGGFGGPNKNCLKCCERYDLISKSWSLIADLNTQRRALSVVCLKSGIYTIGGFDGTNYLATVEK